MRVRCGDPSILYRRLRSTASVSIASAGFLCGKILAKNCEQPKVTSKKPGYWSGDACRTNCQWPQNEDPVESPVFLSLQSSLPCTVAGYRDVRAK